MITVVLVVGSFISGFLLGTYLLFKLILKAYAVDPQAFIKSIEKSVCDEYELHETDELVEFVEVERYERKFLLSFKRNGEFIAQGETFLDAMKNAQVRYPNVHFQYDQEECEVLFKSL